MAVTKSGKIIPVAQSKAKPSVSAPSSSAVPTSEGQENGVKRAQWAVIGLLLFILLVEVIIQPAFQKAFLVFWKRFLPHTPITPENKKGDTA